MIFIVKFPQKLQTILELNNEFINVSKNKFSVQEVVTFLCNSNEKLKLEIPLIQELKQIKHLDINTTKIIENCCA